MEESITNNYILYKYMKRRKESGEREPDFAGTKVYIVLSMKKRKNESFQKNNVKQEENRVGSQC